MPEEKQNQPQEMLTVSEETVEIPKPLEAQPPLPSTQTPPMPEYEKVESPSGVQDAASFEPLPPTPPAPAAYNSKPGGGVKKFLIPIIILIVLLATGTLVYFNKEKLPFLNNKPKLVTIEYWGLWEPEEAMQQIISDYQRTHPNVTINYHKKTLTNYREKLQNDLKEGNGPDIFRYANTWLPMFKNDLEPVPSSIISTEVYEKTFYPITKEDLKIKNSYYGIPIEIDGLGLFYNEDILRSAGEKPPTNWRELTNTAQNLTVRDSEGKIKTAGIAMGLPSNVDHWSDILGLMLLQSGIDFTNPKSDKYITSDEAVAVVSYFTLPVTKYKTWDETQDSSTRAFEQGKLAMYFAPSWKVFEIKDANPKLNFKVVPVPQLVTEEGQKEKKITWGRYWVEGVSKNSKAKAESWDFLKYLSSKEALQKLYAADSKIRLFGPPYSRVDLASSIKLEPYVGAFIEQAPYAKSWYLTSNTADNGINDQMIKYLENAVNATIAKGGTKEAAKEALQTASLGFQEVLTKYGVVSASP